MKAETPKHSTWLVSSVLLKILSGARIQEIHKVRVTRLIEIVHDFANQQVKIELSAKVAQFWPGFAAQNSFSDAQRTSKPSYNATYGGNFHVAGSIAHQVYLATG